MLGLKKAAMVTVATCSLMAGLAGCSGDDSIASLDHGATLTLQGEPSERKVPADGQISVFDVNQQQLVYSGYVRKDEVIKLDPSSNRLIIDGDIARENLQGGDEFQISFAEAP